jgi:hexokinase
MSWKITGSMADVPKDLLEQIKRLEELFTVDQARLKKITDHFVSELAKGMNDQSRDGCVAAIADKRQVSASKVELL